MKTEMDIKAKWNGHGLSESQEVIVVDGCISRKVCSGQTRVKNYA